MTDSSDRIVYPAELTAGSAIQRDARKLQWAVRESVSSSPEAFLAHINDIDAKSASDWIDEIRLSTWAIVERDDEILGIAAAKRPDRDEDKDVNQSTARFIESVWIAGAMRRRGIGRRLVEYLIDIERERHHV
jgi:ribosomal protein S18 acetylase RimI-like enzyme